jgi:hypothetical protein
MTLVLLPSKYSLPLPSSHPLLLDSFALCYVRNIMAVRALPGSRPDVTKTLNDD